MEEISMKLAAARTANYKSTDVDKFKKLHFTVPYEGAVRLSQEHDAVWNSFLDGEQAIAVYEKVIFDLESQRRKIDDLDVSLRILQEGSPGAGISG
jgi:regulatory protein YycI of two-component signal transduction system YycFG